MWDLPSVPAARSFRICCLCLSLAAFPACSLLLTSPGTATPIAASGRAGGYVATLMQAEEPRIPSLHHQPENDRYAISLVLHPLAGGPARTVPLGSGLRLSEFIHGARLLGDDGKRLWFHATETMAYDYGTGRLLPPAELPSGDIPGRAYGFNTPEPWSLLARADRLGAKFNRPAFVLEGPGRDPLHLSSPDSSLVTYRSDGGLNFTILVARITTSGQTLWTADTGLRDLRQVLPGTDYVAFIGQQPPKLKDEVRGPVLVIIDTRNGRTASHSLWIRRQ